MALGVNLNQGMNNNFRPQGGYGTNPMGNPNMMGGPQMAGQGGNIVSNNLMNNFANNRPMWGNGAPGLPQQMPQAMPPMQGTAIQGPQVSGLTGPINGGTNPLQSGAWQLANLGGPGVQMPGGAQMAPQGIGAGGGGMQAINRPQSMMSPGGGRYPI